MRISKSFTFEASHQLPNKEQYGKCRNLHGHSYKLMVTVDGMINPDGWIINFSELDKIVHTAVIDQCDHKHLNDLFPNMITTAENLAYIFSKSIKGALPAGVKLFELTLHETAKCSATYP